MADPAPLVLPLSSVGMAHVAEVGGKSASLGEMISALGEEGIRIPAGFSTTAAAWRLLTASGGLGAAIEAIHRELATGARTLEEAGHELRERVRSLPLPDALREAVLRALEALGDGGGHPLVAVRSSATAEDLPDASFAGQHESFLGVRGEEAVLDRVREAYASLFTDRAIRYRQRLGIAPGSVAQCVAVQKMVAAEGGSSGVAFTLDPDSGFPRVILLNAAWGLGEPVVKGRIDPDQFLIFKPLLERPGAVPILDRRIGSKELRMTMAEGRIVEVETTPAERTRPSLSTDQILRLARWCVRIEAHYGRPMDIEWARDDATDSLYILQARPETVHSASGRDGGAGGRTPLHRWILEGEGPVLARGAAVGGGIAAGRARRMRTPADEPAFRAGEILVTERTDPDWGPVLGVAGGIVTDLGGRTSHAAIVSREIGIPAVVGTTEGTRSIPDGAEITVSCADGDEGRVYGGFLPFRVEEIDPASIPRTQTPVLLNLGNPGGAFRWWPLEAGGVGLLRLEFMIAEEVGIHPMALLHPDRVEDEGERARIRERLGEADGGDHFLTTLISGIARIAALVHPGRALVRTSDFKSNEYAGLCGGRAFEPPEENPMLGLRGASRYRSPRYREAFELECRAIGMVRRELGLDSVVPMIPFCRSPEEADEVLGIMAGAGLERGKDGLEVWMMCEVPSNLVRIEEFAARFDGFSIGSNDLTQLLLGVDRDSAELAPLFSERDPAVMRTIEEVVRRAHAAGRPVSLCGQAPADDPAFAAWLAGIGIDSLSVDPGSFAAVSTALAARAPVLQPG